MLLYSMSEKNTQWVKSHVDKVWEIKSLIWFEKPKWSWRHKPLHMYHYRMFHSLSIYPPNSDLGPNFCFPYHTCTVCIIIETYSHSWTPSMRVLVCNTTISVFIRWQARQFKVNQDSADINIWSFPYKASAWPVANTILDPIMSL